MKILFVDEAFPAARELLGEVLSEHDVVFAAPSQAPRAEVIVPLGARVDAGLMDRVRPRLIQQFGVGLDGVDLEAARGRGIEVANVAAAETGNAEAAAELAVLHLLALYRRFAEAGSSIASRRLGEPVGRSLRGSRLVILGLGAVGRAVARRLAPFELRLVGVGSSAAAPVAETGSPLPLDAYLPSCRLVEALDGADGLVVCCTLSEATRGMVGATELGAMKRESYLVNVARGPVVDYAALLEALRSGRLAGAGLDVFRDEPVDPEDPLLAENVTVTPHLGGVTTESYRRIAERVAENVARLG